MDQRDEIYSAAYEATRYKIREEEREERIATQNKQQGSNWFRMIVVGLSLVALAGIGLILVGGA